MLPIGLELFGHGTAEPSKTLQLGDFREVEGEMILTTWRCGTSWQNPHHHKAVGDQFRGRGRGHFSLRYLRR